jgi:predicted permease
MTTPFADVRYALRALRKSPGFTLTAIATLALGIGVNATVFTVTNAVLFKGFPMVAANDRLAYISDGGCCLSYADFEDYRAQAKSFTDIEITHGIGSVVSGTNGFPENIDITEVSSGTFQLAGQRPIMGRDFTPPDAEPGSARVAILNYGFWERRFGKDPSILGRAIRINGVPTTVIGIMPRGFSFPQKADAWVPLVRTAEALKRDNRDTWFAFGRLRPGVTIENARTEINTITKRLAIAYPATHQYPPATVWNFHQFFIGPDAALIYGSMWGAVAFVLLIACANLANLLLARAIGRSREISVRIALGAGRWRIIRQLLIESVILSGVGGFLGWWIAQWGVRAYQLAMAQKASWLIVDYTMDTRVLAYLIAISIGTGLLFGIAPALRLSRLDVNSTLKDGSRGATGGTRGRRLSALLVTVEMALAVVLLAGAGVMIRSFLKIHNANIGVNTSDILGSSISLPAARYPSPEARITFFDDLQQRLQAIPGVESVAIGAAMPTWSAPQLPCEIAGQPNPLNQDELRRPKLLVMAIGPAYFNTLGAAVRSGREFNDFDTASRAPVAIVNRRFADKFWPGQDAIGKRIRLLDGKPAESWRTVVGVASNIVQNDTTRQQFDPIVYVPYRQKPGAQMWEFVRTRVPPGSLQNDFRRAVQALDPDLPIYGPFALDQRLDLYYDSRFYGSLFLIFAAIALLLASIGLYTVIAHAVSQRTQEIGIRMAIGATTRDILQLVFLQGMLPLAIGLAIGLTASLAVNRILKSELVQVSPYDPLTLVVASAALIFSAMLGCWIPARRAMRVDPVIALRHD